jgi:hydroxymethylpyrimidine/phosphomethylpyrimidine kinase/hydroxymethylpyrimidine kinase/phosphomethylpyrimidine kinase/thiamine-phosphate diphosphorylase
VVGGRRLGGAGAPVVVLTVAGSDSGGGAGIQADLRTFAAHRAYGCSVVTAVTAQDTTGVHGVLPVPPDFVDRQLSAVLGDLPVRAVKTGMLGGAGTVRVVARRASAGELANLVVDPVLVATSGDRLSDVDSVAVVRDELLPYATVATPNAAEAGALLGRPVSTVEEMAAAAEELGRTGAWCVVVTGGDLAGEVAGGMACDALWFGGEVTVLRSRRIDTRNTHGTGCTFSAAVAVGLGRGMAPVDAVVAAKDYLSRALRSAAGWRLGAGRGPVDHLVALTGGALTGGALTGGALTGGDLTGNDLTGGDPHDVDGAGEAT